jgi:hypothetical protein
MRSATKGSYKIGVHEVAAELKVRISLVSRPRSAAPRRISASLKGFSSLQPFFGGIQPTEPHPGVLVMKICYVRFSYSLSRLIERGVPGGKADIALYVAHYTHK